MQKGHKLSTYSKFSAKLTSLTPSYPETYICRHYCVDILRKRFGNTFFLSEIFLEIILEFLTKISKVLCSSARGIFDLEGGLPIFGKWNLG